MAIESDKEIFQSKKPILQAPEPKPTPQHILDTILEQIGKAEEEQCLEYTLPVEDAYLVLQLLYAGADKRPMTRITYNSAHKNLRILIMPSSLHNAFYTWFHRVLMDLSISGHITTAENKGLIMEPGTTFDKFTRIYAGSSKEADLTIGPTVALYPSIVFESGWSESFPALRRDKDLWIGGCGGHVELVILVKFNKLAGGRVSGMIEVWAGDAAANEWLIQTEPIFPAPSAPFAAVQSIKITRSQIFGPQILPGRNPEEVFEFPLDGLRTVALQSLSMMGLQPAQ